MDLLQDVYLIKPLPLGKGHIDVHYKDFCEDDRIIITLRNEYSEIVGFAGRSVRDDQRAFFINVSQSFLPEAKKIPRSVKNFALYFLFFAYSCIRNISVSFISAYVSYAISYPLFFLFSDSFP